MAGRFKYPEIEDLLPHRGRMLLLDKIVYIDREDAVSNATVSPRWPLFNAAGASPIIIIELVAQTSGLNNGMDRLEKEGAGTETKGWLVGIKKANFYVDVLKVGAVVETRTKNSFKFEGFREIEGLATIDNVVVGEVTLQVVRAD